MHVQRNTFCSGSFLTRAIVTKQSHNKLCNWHADSSRRIVVQLSRERTAPRISSWTSLKCYIHFSFVLKLIIFICKQLKGLWLLVWCTKKLFDTEQIISFPSLGPKEDGIRCMLCHSVCVHLKILLSISCCQKWRQVENESLGLWEKWGFRAKNSRHKPHNVVFIHIVVSPWCCVLLMLDLSCGSIFDIHFGSFVCRQAVGLYRCCGCWECQWGAQPFRFYHQRHLQMKKTIFQLILFKWGLKWAT